MCNKNYNFNNLILIKKTYIYIFSYKLKKRILVIYFLEKLKEISRNSCLTFLIKSIYSNFL